METEIFLPLPLNISVKEGDIAYYTKLSGTVGGFTINNNDLVMIGKIKTIEYIDTFITDEDSDGVLDTGDGTMDTAKITCEIDNNTSPPEVGDFIFFAKPRSVEEASIVGYYADVVFKNNSLGRIELFTTSCEITPSS